MKRPSLLLILSAGHSLIWSAGVFAVMRFLSMSGTIGAGAVWAATAGTFIVIFSAHLVIGAMVRKRIGAASPRASEAEF